MQWDIVGENTHISKSHVPVKSIGTAYTFLSVIIKKEILMEKRGKTGVRWQWWWGDCKSKTTTDLLSLKGWILWYETYFI